MAPTGTAKEFDIWQSERSFRYKEEALVNHAPHQPGIYEISTFPPEGGRQVVYAGLALDRGIFDALTEHWDGRREPVVSTMFEKFPNLYFSYVSETSAKTPEDLQDLFWAMVQKNKPALLDASTVKPTGRYSEITYKDRSIL